MTTQSTIREANLVPRRRIVLGCVLGLALSCAPASGDEPAVAADTVANEPSTAELATAELGATPAVEQSSGLRVVVVCPETFTVELQRWSEHRRQQGMSVCVIPSEPDADTLRERIAAASDPQTRYVMLVGDAPTIGSECDPTVQVPSHYAPADVTSAWGSTPTLPTDMVYGDFDNDGIPNAVVGRLPVDRPDQLRSLVDRIIAHEASEDFGPWRGQVQLTGGVGGFGLVADTAIESVTRSVVTGVLPPETRTSVAYASPGHPFFPTDVSFTDAVLNRYEQGSRFWVYAGHGQVTALDRVPRSEQGIPVLDRSSVRRLRRPHGGSPIAVILACYTGAIDAPQDSLAEEMVLCDGGPIAVLAGSRVTMPYGNVTAAIGLIDAVFEQRSPRLGDAWLSTLLEMHRETRSRRSGSQFLVDALAGLISPTGTNLVGERREHMQLYHLLGDPTLKLHHPELVEMELAADHDAGEPIALNLNSPIDGALTLTFDRPLGAVTEGDPNQTTVASITAEVLAGRMVRQAVSLPAEVSGPILVRAFVSGKKSWATAAAKTIIRSSAALQLEE